MSMLDLYKVCDERFNLLIKDSKDEVLMLGSIDDVPVGMFKRNIIYITRSVIADIEIVIE